MTRHGSCDHGSDTGILCPVCDREELDRIREENRPEVRAEFLIAQWEVEE